MDEAEMGEANMDTWSSLECSVDIQLLALHLSRQVTAIRIPRKSNQDAIASSNRQALINCPINISDQTFTLIREDQISLSLNLHISSHDMTLSH